MKDLYLELCMNLCRHMIWFCLYPCSLCCPDRPFIMEIPALPVMAGSDVTLRCRNRYGSTIPVNFFKFGRHSAPIRAAPEGEFTISNVQQSDEGFYWCSTGQTESPSSRLNVRGQDTHIYFLFPNKVESTECSHLCMLFSTFGT